MAMLAIMLMGAMSACNDSPYPGYQKTDTGLYYQFFKENQGEQPKVGDLMDMIFSCTVNDTINIFPKGPQTLPLEAPLFAGDFYEGAAMMHKGDSASFIVNIDSTFIKWFHQRKLPDEFKSTDVMRFEIRLDDFYPENEYAARLGAKIKKSIEARIEKIKADHPEETAMAAQQLTEYLAKNKVNVEPTASGLYYVMTKEGNGEKPEVGQMVQVHYTGTLLDGTVFDSSAEKEPITFPIGLGQVIPGWDEGIQMMSKGEKGMLYIPYYLAYGEQQRGEKITPFSNLVFEVELVDFQ